MGAEAYSFNEFGDGVTFAGSNRVLNTVTVTMSSWGCQYGTWVANDCATPNPATKFSEPITLNIYNPASLQGDGTVRPGSLITTATKTFNLPYRPSANLRHCNSGNGKLGEWWDATLSSCFNGKAVNISWNFGSLHLTLPDSVVIGVAYNTTHHGYSPIGEAAACYSTDAGCPYDALNIGLNPAVTTGSQTWGSGTVFQNAASQSEYCDSTPAVGAFNLDSPTNNTCWAGYVPAIQVSAR